MKRNPEDPVRKDPSNPVQFSGPVVSPQVTDPQALKYAQGIANRKQPPRYSAPVAGGASPPMPRLDLPAAENLTMADQAQMQRAAAEGPPRQAPAPMGGMFQGAPPSGPISAPQGGPEFQRQSGMSRPPPGLLPNDLLPNEVRSDPDFIEGQGSMYAVAQPRLAYKYGVIRNGQRIAPQQLNQPNKSLSQKSIEDLKTIQELQKTRAAGESEDARVEKEAAASTAGAAGRFGNAPTDGPVADPDAKQKNLVEAVKKMDDFDFATFRDMMMKDIINNEEQREIIEKRLKPMDVTDLIVRGYVTQRVPIIPEKFEPEFQSMSGKEDLAIKQLIMAESKGVEVSERYLLDKFALMALTLGLRSINGNVLPDHRDQSGRFEEEAFWKKFERVSAFPYHMLASIGVNYFWFDIRVRKLFVAEKLGNG